MKAVAGEGPLGRRPQPQIVMNARRRRFFRRPANRVPPFKTEAARHVHVADHAFAEFFHAFPHARRRAAVGAVLDDAVVFAGRLHQLRAFKNVVGAGLLDVHILARLTGPDAHQRVPVIRRGDGDGVDGFVFQQLAHIGIGGWTRLAGRLDLGQAASQDGFVHVAQRGDLHVGHGRVGLDVGIALPAHAYHRHSHGVIGAAKPRRKLRTRRRRGQKMSPLHAFHSGLILSVLLPGL